jgi:hypothetical protein
MDRVHSLCSMCVSFRVNGRETCVPRRTMISIRDTHDWLFRPLFCEAPPESVNMSMVCRTVLRHERHIVITIRERYTPFRGINGRDRNITRPDYFAVSTSDTHSRDETPPPPIHHLVHCDAVSHESTLSPGVFHCSEGLTVPQMAYSTPAEYPVSQV